MQKKVEKTDFLGLGNFFKGPNFNGEMASQMPNEHFLLFFLDFLFLTNAWPTKMTGKHILGSPSPQKAKIS